jgi:adenosylmethionine-8-amino-7-oxononanoate aminotransferase
VAPDFLCLAKGLTGGYLPLAATLTTDAVYEAFLGRPEEGRTFFHGHTYTGNPLGSAVALANLDLLNTESFWHDLPAKIERLSRHLRRMTELPCVGDVRQRGLMAGIELVEDRTNKRPFPPATRMGARVCRLARQRGVLLRPLGDVVVVMPPLAVDDSLMDQLCGVLYDCIREGVHGS